MKGEGTAKTQQKSTYATLNNEKDLDTDWREKGWRITTSQLKEASVSFLVFTSIFMATSTARWVAKSPIVYNFKETTQDYSCRLMNHV
ncbi:hypothetical protein ASPBRDRAFT_463872 [Aspergillus brasiliensis CBS 101740]|uniref:Uncharacterized protein n=1 Tax=Aspergillus brasiliensis (strain CBS 101740 / IMI 381727 / IBT 21946) TaxID=767769 RepID=A0A1L9UTI4_ASPBC|nr:hypothetical protein ASPBRDRAFT_463872 [Aspergillus brasiliensis CBS 101740]